MKLFFKITGVALLFYAATLASQPEVRKAVAKQADSLSFYYNISEEELRQMADDREFEGKPYKKGGKKSGN
jgi:hypothetical protein